MQKIITPRLFFLFFFFQFSFFKNVIFLLFFHTFISLLSASLYWVTHVLASPFIKHLLSAVVYWRLRIQPGFLPSWSTEPSSQFSGYSANILQVGTGEGGEGPLELITGGCVFPGGQCFQGRWPQVSPLSSQSYWCLYCLKI